MNIPVGLVDFMLKLVPPSARYKKSYLSALREFKKEGTHEKLNYKRLSKSFSKFVKRFKEDAAGRDLPRGYVPMTTYWLVDGNAYIGSVRIRHYLNRNLRRLGGHIGYEVRPSERRRGYGAKILRLALPKARKLGIANVLLTCDSNNIASRKIIEKAGGIFKNSVAMGKDKPARLRYWVYLKR